MTENTVGSQSLYERIGGESMITQLVDKLYDSILADPELAPFFKHSSMERMRCMQKEFFITALGGTPNYVGLSVVKAHQGRGIKLRHFNLFAQHLLAALKELNVSEAETDAVIALINLLANDVTGDSINSD